MPDLPQAMLAPTVHLVGERRAWDALTNRLWQGAPNEACAFILTRPSRGVGRVSVLLGEVIWPEGGELTASPQSLELHADFISRAMDQAVDCGPEVGLALVHTHPHTVLGAGVGRFSRRDDWYDARLFSTVCSGRPRALGASLVLGQDGSVDGRVWWDGGTGLRVHAAQCLRIVGPSLQFIELAGSTWADHPEPELMDRSTRVWGAEGRRVLQNLVVGVVGVGGTGSIATMALATMGVGTLKLFDKDILKAENLHRIVGPGRADVGREKVWALADRTRASATAKPFVVKPTVDWGTSAAALKELKDCDVVFSCVDQFAPRVALNDLAYRHLVPVIDMASWIHPNRGVIDAIMTQAEIFAPGIPCAWCNGTLSSRKLTLEAQGRQRDADFRVAYGLPLEDTDGVEPSVLPLNLAGVGLAMMMFIQVVLRISSRTPRRLKLFLPERELDESDLDSLPECGCTTELGTGDTLPIRPVEG